MLVARWRGSNKEFAFVSVDAASVSEKTSSQNGCVGCLHGPVVEEGYFLQTLRPMCCSALCDVVVILLNLMIWHSNCSDKRSRTVVVPHCTINQWRTSEIDDLCLSNSLLSCVHSWTIIVCSRVVEEIYQSVIIFSEKCHQLGDDECADSVAAQSISSSISIDCLQTLLHNQQQSLIAALWNIVVQLLSYPCGLYWKILLFGWTAFEKRRSPVDQCSLCAADWKEVRNLLLLTMKLHQWLAFSLSGTVLIDALVEPVSLKIEADPRQPK
ncbi:hypothetical protein T05_10247 [Trichinella murrelli]|uniref:Uncharacterized protein n=1 Tax=Trichinella murrelli TaxID=144512 RepID=A0A0V0TE02_9BILA|nr:hypothetical protein T05_10247 [Trichinella murrelli]